MPTVETNGASIYYEVYGEGPAITFAHGRGGNAASWWQQVPKFAQYYKVIVFDHRIFGRSVCAPENFDRSLFDSDLLAILDVEGVEKTAIVCQSMGGWTGLKTAVFHPQRVSCLVLSNTPGGLNIPPVQDALVKSRQRFAEQGVGRAAVAPDFPERNPEGAYLYRQIGSLNINLPEDLSGRNPGGVSPSDMAGYSVPTLMITSEHDALFTPALIREVATHIPGAEIIELPTAGHSPYFETPDAFNQTIANFLSKHI
jgi:3-oxoadipate enol-lactonase